MFVFVLGILEKASLLHGKYLGIDVPTMEANAVMKSIVLRERARRIRKCSNVWLKRAASRRRPGRS